MLLTLMQMQKLRIDLFVALLIVAIAIALSVIVYMRLVSMSIFFGPLRLSHWVTIIGSTYIAVATPIFAVLKQKYPQKMLNLYRFHMFGNLSFFAFIAVHFFSQMSRSTLPDIGTGAVLFLAMALQVASGFTQMFHLTKGVGFQRNRFFHASLIAVFYMTIVFHTLHGFGLI
jgi:hypothetical protein